MQQALMRIHSNSDKFKQVTNYKLSSMIHQYFWVWIILILLFRLWLISSQNLHAIGNAGYDDLLFVKLASHIIRGEWLGPFDQLTLTKGSFYPIWIALSYPFGLPLLVMQHLLYLIASVFFVYVFRKSNIHAVFLLVLFALLAFNPSTTALPANRVTRDFFYGSETLIVFAAIFGLFFAFKNQKKTIIWCIILGFSLIPFVLTREEGVWIAPAYVFANLYLVLSSPKNKSYQEKIKRTALLCIPLVILFTGTSLIKLKNLIEYGVWINTEFQADYFKAAYGSLTRVRHDHWQRYVNVPYDVRKKIYEISPAFAELEPYLEGNLLHVWTRSGCKELNICDDYSSHFVWAFRHAVSLAGYYRSELTAKDYYTRLASEVNQACEQEKLKCYPPRKTMLPVFHEEYVSLILQEFLHMLKYVATFEDTSSLRVPKNKGTTSQLRLFEEITHYNNLIPKTITYVSGDIENESGLSITLRECKKNAMYFIAKGYQVVVPGFFVISLLCFICALEKSTRSGLSLLTTFSIIILAAFLSRLLLLSYLDLTSFHAFSLLYNMPSYILLLIFSEFSLYDTFWNNRVAPDSKNVWNN